MTTLAQENKHNSETRTTSDVKNTLALVFDDNLLTKDPKWKNIPDYIIIGLIVISTIGVFLSTFSGVVERIGGVLTFIDWFTVIFFTIEIALRIWTADLLDKKYKGFGGRIRYCFSFYGFIDLLSTVPFYLNFFISVPYSILKVFRAFRLLRLFRYMKSSRLLVRAITSKKDELLTSMAFLTLLTVILSFLLYFTEHAEQPDLCENGWGTFLWTFAKYLGDPGKIADFTLLSPWSNFIAFIVGVLGVAIFAIPTGLIASGFTDAMDEEKHNREIIEYGQRMRKLFRRDVNLTLRQYLSEHPDHDGVRPQKLLFVPQRIPVAKIQLRQGIELKDIFNVCQEYAEFQVKNLAGAYSAEEHVDDRFVVEHFPINRPYGCCIDRHSRVTIVSPSSFNENGTGWFTYYLAKLGGFNYVSKNIEVDPNELDSFYNMTAEALYERQPRSQYLEKKKENKDAIEMIDKKEKNRKAFIDDLRKFQGEDAWMIFFVAHIKNSQNHFDFHFAASKKNGSEQTVNQKDVYDQLCQQLSQKLEEDHNLKCDICSDRYPLTANFLGYRLRREGITQNCFALRPSTDIINFANGRHLIIYQMAGIISQLLDNGKGMEPNDVTDFETSAFGYCENLTTKSS